MHVRHCSTTGAGQESLPPWIGYWTARPSQTFFFYLLILFSYSRTALRSLTRGAHQAIAGAVCSCGIHCRLHKLHGPLLHVLHVCCCAVGARVVQVPGE